MSGPIRAVVTAAIAVLVAACGSTPPSGEPGVASGRGAGDGQPVSATNQADGLLVTLSASSDRVTAGDRIRIRISALNAGLGAVAYESGGCGPIGGLQVAGPPVPNQAEVAPPAGNDVDAVLGLARWSALSQAGPGVDWIRTPGIPDDLPMGCPANLAYDEIPPGGTLDAEAIWIARMQDGSPAPAGAYQVTLSFPFAGRRSREEVPFEGDVVTPIRVAVPLLVLQGPAVGITAAEAVDAAITDPRVRAWAEQQLTRQSLSGGSIRFVNGAWRFRIDAATGRADVIVDAQSGAIREVALTP